MEGPLAGIRVLELAGIGPAPFCGMVLADLGAEVRRIDRPGGHPDAWGRSTVLARGKRTEEVDLKCAAGVERVLELVEASDALVEGFRPGVAERLGLGPDECLARNPRLVYGRMTGWGQDGPNSQTAGHDINFLALSGVLHAIGRSGELPVPPINLLGDFGGGGMLLALGVVSALLASGRSGQGQVVDAAILDGAALLAAMIYGFLGEGSWRDEPGANLLDGGAPFYDTYECADGRYVAVGALEPAFYGALVERLGLATEMPAPGEHLDRSCWPAIRVRLTAAFRARGRDEWAEFFAGSDCCVSPVLSLGEAPANPHNRARGVFRVRDGAVEPAPAPRFSGRSQ